MRKLLMSTVSPEGYRRRRLYLDIETRSRIDLKKSGQYAYAEDSFTQIILVSWAVDDGPLQTWYCLRGDTMPALLRECFLDGDTILVAHNASFERVLLSLVGPRFMAPDVVAALRPIWRWNCTAARAAALGLPRTLDGAAHALGLSVTKDLDGKKLMLQMCAPRGVDGRGLPIWREAPADMLRLGQYCEVDVEVERHIDRLLPELIAEERETWESTEGINDRGVTVDTQLLGHLIPFVDEAERDVNERLRQATDGQVPKVSNHLKLRAWLVGQGYEDFETTGVGKAAVSDALAAFASRDDLTNRETLIRDVLLMRQEGGKSSAAKYRSVLGRLNKDGVIRGTLVYCGAGSTSRWSSRGAQLQNLPRGGTIKTIDTALTDMLDSLPLEVMRSKHGSPLVIASELLRPMFRGRQGYWLARGDYSQVEMRTNYWLAGDTKKLDAFRAYDTIVGYEVNKKGKLEAVRGGPDMYCVTAQGITGKPVGKDDPERQYGKVLGLACGFLGGVGAFQAFAKLYNVKIDEAKAKGLVDAWRADNKAIMQLGWDLDKAAIECAQAKSGHEVQVRHNIRFKRSPRAMTLRMPSGRSLIYWWPSVEKQKTPWGEKLGVVYWAEDAVKKVWSKQRGWGGIWLENITQATARDIMRDALNSLARASLNPILLVHDEAVCQVSKDLYPEAKSAAEAVRVIMAESSKWATGLPVAVDASAGDRYVKA